MQPLPTYPLQLRCHALIVFRELSPLVRPQRCHVSIQAWQASQAWIHGIQNVFVLLVGVQYQEQPLRPQRLNAGAAEGGI